MKLKSLIIFSLLAPAIVFFTQGCDKCKESGTITIAETKQFFSVTYLEDSSGINYAQNIWRPQNVSIMFSSSGKFGPFAPMTDNLSDGIVGPLPYTTKPQLAKKGNYYDYMYIVRKDTFGIDTFQVKFYPAVDECKEYWGVIEYFKNGQIISSCTDKETCSIVIRE